MMPGLLTHTPSDIVRRLAIQRGLGADPPAVPWPVYNAQEPDIPERLIYTVGTTPVIQGRVHISGEVDERYGIQFTIRGGQRDANVAEAKANAIAVSLDKVYQEEVLIDSVRYLVHDFVRTSGPIPLGEGDPASRRVYVTLNLTVLLEQLPPTPVEE